MGKIANLDEHGPLEAPSLLDDIVQLPLRIVGIRALGYHRLVEVELLCAVVRFVVVLTRSQMVNLRIRL